MAEPPYGVRMFGASEAGPGAPAAIAGKGRLLVTGGGGPPAWPSGSNKLAILEFEADCNNQAELGQCSEVLAIQADHNSTAHFSAIDESTKDIYLCEVSHCYLLVRYPVSLRLSTTRARIVTCWSGIDQQVLQVQVLCPVAAVIVTDAAGLSGLGLLCCQCARLDLASSDVMSSVLYSRVIQMLCCPR